MKTEDRQEYVKDGKKFSRDSKNHFTDLCAATGKIFNSLSEDKEVRKYRLKSHEEERIDPNQS